MRWLCKKCQQTFRRFSTGPGRCPKCGFVPDWEADGYEDDAEILDYWQFRPVFEPRRWLRRQLKLLIRSASSNPPGAPGTGSSSPRSPGRR